MRKHKVILRLTVNYFQWKAGIANTSVCNDLRTASGIQYDIPEIHIRERLTQHKYGLLKTTWEWNRHSISRE